MVRSLLRNSPAEGLPAAVRAGHSIPMSCVKTEGTLVLGAEEGSLTLPASVISKRGGQPSTVLDVPGACWEYIKSTLGADSTHYGALFLQTGQA